jgi:hypothetical protein
MLQRTRADMAKEISAIVEREWQCSLAEVLYIIECVSKGNHEPFKQPAQKAHEPELFICPNAGKFNWDGGCEECTHSKPHKWSYACQKESAECCGECVQINKEIPQPTPVPTSGTGTAPEGATVTYIPPDEIDAFRNHLVDIQERTYPGMAKDIGDLIIRMDNMERSKNIQNAAISKHASQIYDLETTLKAIQKEIDLLKRNTS